MGYSSFIPCPLSHLQGVVTGQAGVLPVPQPCPAFLSASLTLSVGFWEGVIARSLDGGYELAFGHHRLEAARQLGFEHIPLIVRELSDEQLLKFMARENQEDYNANFLVMLETWEAAQKFFMYMKNSAGNPPALDVAKFLGWTFEQKQNNSTYEVMNPLAQFAPRRFQAVMDGAGGMC